MRKPPKPWYREQTRCWYVQLDGSQRNLGSDEASLAIPWKERRPPRAVWDKYDAIMEGRKDIDSDSPVAVVFDRYLCWLKDNRSAATFASHRQHLQSFKDYVGERLTVASLTPKHVTDWQAEGKRYKKKKVVEIVDGEKVKKVVTVSLPPYKARSADYQNTAIRAVQRALNWAVKRGDLLRSPLAFIEDKPSPVPRDCYIDESQWEAWLTEARKMRQPEAFIELLTFLRNTGCRPQEVRIIEARHVQNGCVDIERKLAKGKLERRIVPLNPVALEIVTRLAEKYPTGPLFRNRADRPWTRHAINCRFQRLHDKLEKSLEKEGKKLDFPVHAYALRHAFATDAIVRGVDVITLAQIMGHRNLAMLNRVYSHVAKKSDHMRSSMLKATGFPLPATGYTATPAST